MYLYINIYVFVFKYIYIYTNIKRQTRSSKKPLSFHIQLTKTNYIVPLSRHHMFQMFSSFTFENLEMPVASSPHHDFSHR